VEGEDAARAGLRIADIAEEGLDAGGFVGEGNRLRAGEKVGEKIREAFAVVAGLLGDGGEGGAGFLGLDHAEGQAIDEEEIIAAAGRERDLAEGDAAGGGGVIGAIILDGPAGGDEESVDFFAGGGFGGHGGREDAEVVRSHRGGKWGGWQLFHFFRWAGTDRRSKFGDRRSKIGDGRSKIGDRGRQREGAIFGVEHRAEPERGPRRARSG
jgi:hypothetical protein